MDRLVVVLGLVLIAMTAYFAWISEPPVAEALRSAVLPERVDFLAVTTLVGGTVGGYITYAGARRIVDAGVRGAEHVHEIARASVTGVLVTGAVRVLLFLPYSASWNPAWRWIPPTRRHSPSAPRLARSRVDRGVDARVRACRYGAGVHLRRRLQRAHPADRHLGDPVGGPARGGPRSSLAKWKLRPIPMGRLLSYKVSSVTPNDDGVFGRPVQSLYTELRTALDEFTCVPVKSTLTNKPLINPTCDQLRKYWDSGKQKLDACVNAAFQPKASASNQNCQSFRNQFDSYKAALPATTSGRPDLANRPGEQKWRWEVTKHVFEARLLPSIPPNGYCRERYPAGTTACPNTPL